MEKSALVHIQAEMKKALQVQGFFHA